MQAGRQLTPDGLRGRRCSERRGKVLPAALRRIYESDMGNRRFGQSWTVPWLAFGQPRQSVRFAVSRHLALWLGAVFLTVTRAAICVADFDMTGTWNSGTGPFAFAVLNIVQTGTSLSISVTPVPLAGGTGTIDPMTGAFSMEFPLLDPPTTCAATFTGQLSPDGNTFTAPGMVLTTSPDCLSFSCACAETDPVELRGSRAPCGNGTVDAGEECDDATFGFPGSCCALNCTALPAGGSCFDDGNLCTDDICGAGGACTHPALPDGTACNDGRFCDGEETDCQGGVCTAGTAPCPLACDESTDQCVTACPFSPQSCRTAQKTLFSLKLRSDPTQDKLLWKWLKGTSTSQMEFGDPTDTADYALCMYGTLSSLLVAETVIPAGTTAWSALDLSGYKYNDPSGAVHNIERVLLKASGENKSKVLIKGHGADLPPLSLPLTSPLTVQLYNGRNGLCWGANYSLAQMRKNEANRLKAKTP